MTVYGEPIVITLPDSKIWTDIHIVRQGKTFIIGNPTMTVPVMIGIQQMTEQAEREK